MPLDLTYSCPWGRIRYGGGGVCVCVCVRMPLDLQMAFGADQVWGGGEGGDDPAPETLSTHVCVGGGAGSCITANPATNHMASLSPTGSSSAQCPLSPIPEP